MEKLSRQGVLNELAKVGKQVAEKAEPSYWSFEDMGRSKEFQAALPKLRWQYKAIRDGKNLETALDEISKIVPLLAGDRLHLIKQAIHGFPADWSWTVQDDAIVFVEDTTCDRCGKHIQRSSAFKTEIWTGRGNYIGEFCNQACAHAAQCSAEG